MFCHLTSLHAVYEHFAEDFMEMEQIYVLSTFFLSKSRKISRNTAAVIHVMDDQ